MRVLELKWTGAILRAGGVPWSNRECGSLKGSKQQVREGGDQHMKKRDETESVRKDHRELIKKNGSSLRTMMSQNLLTEAAN